METQRIATRLVELCRKAEYGRAQDELYASNAASIEPEGSPWSSATGIQALKAKVDKWHEMVKVIHASDVSDPMVAGSFFTVTMAFDLTLQDGARTQSEEIAVYEVKDGKVVKEQFFYSI